MTLVTAKDEDIFQQVTVHLSEKFNVTLEGGVTQHTDLFQEGLIDSLGFIELVGFLQKTFSIHFEESEFESNSLNTVADIVATVKRKTIP
jgi:D-alanine--poly(phosphoribitol) ligase subunit 2